MKISEKTAYNIYVKEVGASLQPRDLELSAETRRKIFLMVLIGHMIFFSIPFIISYIARYFIPKKPPMIKVKLVEEQKAIPQPPKPPPPKPEPPKPEPPKPEIPRPEPKIDPPKEEPKPPKEPPKQEPKAEPKPEPKIEKPVVKVPEEKPQPQKPQWKPKDPKEITVSREVVKVNKPTQPKSPEVDASKIRERLMKIQSQMKVTSSPSTPTSSQPPSDYFDRVAAFLYEQWIQPSKVELRGAKPKVAVTIQVDGTGRILSASIKRRSGIPAMDNSVDQLLQSISSLPPPPSGGLTFDVSLEISD